MSEASSFERSEKLTFGGFGSAVSPPTGFEAGSHKNLRSSSKNDLIWRFLDTFEIRLEKCGAEYSAPSAPAPPGLLSYFIIKQ